MAQELVEALDALALSPSKTLRAMLDEYPQHRTERRGCGLTQATRLLASHVNRPRDPLDTEDLTIFADWPLRATTRVASRSIDLGWEHGWRRLHDAPVDVRASINDFPGAAELLSLPARLLEVRERLRYPESRIILALIGGILSFETTAAPALPEMPEKPEIGSCSQAEEYFLEIAHGKIRRGGRVNIFLDEDHRPVLVEKIHLGESHSAIFLRELSICEVAIPPGGLAALRHHDNATPLAEHRHGLVFPMTALHQARFLRLTTLALAPEDRKRAFGEQYLRQIRGNMLSPSSTTINDLIHFSEACLDGC